MSEYQSYEWQIIDRPLTEAEQAVVNKLSSPSPVPRTVGALLESAKQVRQAARQRQAEKARKKHIAEMKELAKREPQVWLEVERIIESGKSASVYEQATKLLDKLKQLSEFQNTRDLFQTRLHRLAEKYAGRHSLIRRRREKSWV